MNIHPSSEIDYLVSLLEKLAWPEELQRNTGTTSMSFFHSLTWPKEVHETLDTTSIAFFGGWTWPEEVHEVIRCHCDEQRRFARCCYDEPPRPGHYFYCVFGSGTWSEEVHRNIGRYLYCVCRRRGGQRETICQIDGQGTIALLRCTTTR